MFHVRSAMPGDAPDWLRMREALWPDDGAGSHAGEIEQFFAGALRMPLEVLVAVDETGGAVGFAELSIRNYAEDCLTDRVAYLEGWYVAPEWRRRGASDFKLPYFRLPTSDFKLSFSRPPSAPTPVRACCPPA